MDSIQPAAYFCILNLYLNTVPEAQVWSMAASTIQQQSGEFATEMIWSPEPKRLLAGSLLQKFLIHLFVTCKCVSC